MIEEALLYRRVPGMVGQLDRLLAASEAPNISIRVMPADASLHRAATAGNFVILDFPKSGSRAAEPTTVYHESLTGALYLDRLDEVRAYAQSWTMLEAHALSTDDSRKLLRTSKERHHGA